MAQKRFKVNHPLAMDDTVYFFYLIERNEKFIISINKTPIVAHADDTDDFEEIIETCENFFGILPMNSIMSSLKLLNHFQRITWAECTEIQFNIREVLENE